MDALRATAAAGRPDAEPVGGERSRAERAANQFEALFVRTMVASLRETTTFGDGQGMFGSGPGSETYADWFDQNLAEQVMTSGEIGIRSSLMRDFERAGALGEPAGKAALDAAAAARAAADRNALHHTRNHGGIDVRS